MDGKHLCRKGPGGPGQQTECEPAASSVAKAANSFLDCIRKSIASSLREMILPFCGNKKRDEKNAMKKILLGTWLLMSRTWSEGAVLRLLRWCFRMDDKVVLEVSTLNKRAV